jgi:hypothetical protein
MWVSLNDICSTLSHTSVAYAAYPPIRQYPVPMGPMQMDFGEF